MLMHALPNQGGRTLLVFEVKREVGANYEEVKKEDKRWDKVDTTPVHARVCKIKPGKIMYARYFCLICMCFVEFLCARVSCKIWENPGHV